MGSSTSSTRFAGCTRNTMLDLVKKVITLTKSQSSIIHQPLPADDPTQRKPVIDLAKKELDWAPRIDLDEGLKLTIEYFKTVV